jgi:XTP/dITP diphosphohydrolase
VQNEEEVKQNWEKLKLKEGKGKRTVLGGVPNSLPALIKAYRIQDKAAQVKFEWDNIEDVWAKVKEETAELEEAVASKQQEKIEEEFGDMLFAMVNYARYLKVDAEAALERTNLKFMRRFNYIETQANERGVELDKMSLEEMDAIWNQAKTKGL